MNKRIFVMSWFYPPINSSESFVTYKLLSHSKFNYDVWTRESIDSQVWDRGIDGEPMFAENIKVLKKAYRNVNEWIDAAYQYFIQHADEYSCIMTRSMPPESHRFGKMVKRKYPGIKWIASYGDPLVETPYLKTDYNKNPYLLKRYIERENPSKLKIVKLAVSPTRNAKKILWKKEKKATGEDTDFLSINDYTLRMADAVIVNNEYQKQYIFSGRNSNYSEKCLIVPHSFDDELYPKRNKKRSGKVVFSYTGHLDTIRNSMVLLKSIKRMIKNDPELCNKAEFNFYGHMSDKDKLFIIDNNLFDIVKLNDAISYKESLGVMKDSDILLLIDANFNGIMDENVYFAAKLADYIGSETPIMSITQLDGISADIVRGIGGLVCTHSEDEITMYLSMIIYKHYRPAKASKVEREKFDVCFVAKQYDCSVEGLLK